MGSSDQYPVKDDYARYNSNNAYELLHGIKLKQATRYSYGWLVVIGHNPPRFLYTKQLTQWSIYADQQVRSKTGLSYKLFQKLFRLEIARCGQFLYMLRLTHSLPWTTAGATDTLKISPSSPGDVRKSHQLSLQVANIQYKYHLSLDANKKTSDSLYRYNNPHLYAAIATGRLLQIM